MTRRITVSPEVLLSASEKIEAITANYQRVYMKLYSEIESMNAAWDGADNVAYVSRVKGFQDDFQLMYKLMLEYAQFVRMSAKSYRSTQDDIISAASNLSTGSQSSVPDSIQYATVEQKKFIITGPCVHPGDTIHESALKKFEAFFEKK